MAAVDSRRRALAAALGLAALTGAQPMRAQPVSGDASMYRPGLPPVLAPELPSPIARGPDLDAFRAAYLRAGRPRVVVFWNRELDADLVDRKSETVDLKAAGVQAGPAAVGVISSVRQERLDNAAPRGGLPPALGPLESGFVQRLVQTGVRLVDRASVLRLEHAKGRRAGMVENDTRANEIDAISERADVLLEVAVLKSGPLPDGVELKLLAKDTRSGELLFALTSRGRAPGEDERHWRAGAQGFEPAPGAAPAPSRFVAGNDGFEREAPVPRTLQDVGQQLALDLVQAWQGVMRAQR